MNIKDCIEPKLYTKELEEQIKNAKVYPLIQELYLVFELKVSSVQPISWHEYDGKYQYRYGVNNPSESSVNNRDIMDCFMVSHRGLPAALVFYDTPNDRYSFHYRATVKERGRNSWDRKTISSVKISQIIKTIHKKDINFASAYDHLIDATSTKGHYQVDYRDDGKDYKKALSSMQDKFKSHQKSLLDSYKGRDSMLALIDNVYGDKKPIAHEFDKFFNEYIDKGKKLCETYESAKEMVDSETKNGFYALGINACTETVIAGTYVPDEKYDKHGDREYWKLQDTEVIQGIEDYKSYDDINSILTMLKITLEEKETDNYSFQIINEYWINSSYLTWIEELGVLYKAKIYSEQQSSNPFSIYWLLIAKGDECTTETETQVSEEKM